MLFQCDVAFKCIVYSVFTYLEVLDYILFCHDSKIIFEYDSLDIFEGDTQKYLFVWLYLRCCASLTPCGFIEEILISNGI